MSELRDNPLIQLVDELARTQGRVKHLFAAVSADSGLGSTDGLVLAAILEAAAPPTVPQIGRSLGHPRQVIQRAVNKLVAAGYIRKLSNPDHKRAPLLAATPAGMELKQRGDRLALDIADAFLDAVDQHRVTRLVDELHTVRQAIETFLRDRGEG
jgi:DNA-binding MarR family transcriptional regulator